jgi:hypothetical protein
LKNDSPGTSKHIYKTSRFRLDAGFDPLGHSYDIPHKLYHAVRGGGQYLDEATIQVIKEVELYESRSAVGSECWSNDTKIGHLTAYSCT